MEHSCYLLKGILDYNTIKSLLFPREGFYVNFHYFDFVIYFLFLLPLISQSEQSPKRILRTLKDYSVNDRSSLGDRGYSKSQSKTSVNYKINIIDQIL